MSPNRLDVERIRRDFPVLDQEVHGKPLVYLDNAATSQKPTFVIDAVRDYYLRDNSNVHRGLHTLSERATMGYEGARQKMKQLLNAGDAAEIVFVRGATEGLNLVAQAWGHANVKAGDEVLITMMEHHSNIVPWQMLCEQTGATLKVVPITDTGELEPGAFEKLLSDRTRVVGIVHVSNALGTINPVRELVAAAHEVGALTVVDGAQAVPHMRVNVQELDCDFYAVSGHKMFGPTGIGVLYGKKEHLESMPPWQGGGEMITKVSFDGTEYARVPHKFEAGTPNIAGSIGLGAAVDYMESLGLDAIAAWESELLEYGTAKLREIDGVTLVGTAPRKAGVLSFTLEGVHPHDIGTVLDREGIAVRAGHHCAQPVMTRFGIPATARASLAFYNTKEEIDALAAGVRRVIEMFG